MKYIFILLLLPPPFLFTDPIIEESDAHKFNKIYEFVKTEKSQCEKLLKNQMNLEVFLFNVGRMQAYEEMLECFSWYGHIDKCEKN